MQVDRAVRQREGVYRGIAQDTEAPMDALGRAGRFQDRPRDLFQVRFERRIAEDQAFLVELAVDEFDLFEQFVFELGELEVLGRAGLSRGLAWQ